MAKIVFTANIQRHVFCPEAEVVGRTVREVLENAFAEHPQARGYVLDDQSALRKHMNIFVDGQIIRDRALLFVSLDEGKTFSEMNGIEPSTCCLPVVVHSCEANTAWLVP